MLVETSWLMHFYSALQLSICEIAFESRPLTCPAFVISKQENHKGNVKDVTLLLLWWFSTWLGFPLTEQKWISASEHLFTSLVSWDLVYIQRRPTCMCAAWFFLFVCFLNRTPSVKFCVWSMILGSLCTDPTFKGPSKDAGKGLIQPPSGKTVGCAAFVSGSL